MHLKLKAILIGLLFFISQQAFSAATSLCGKQNLFADTATITCKSNYYDDSKGREKLINLTCTASLKKETSCQSGYKLVLTAKLDKPAQNGSQSKCVKKSSTTSFNMSPPFKWCWGDATLNWATTGKNNLGVTIHR